jgi:hypothetical protein
MLAPFQLLLKWVHDHTYLNRHPPELHANDLRSTYGNRCNHYMLCISVFCAGVQVVTCIYLFALMKKQGIHRDGLDLYSLVYGPTGPGNFLLKPKNSLVRKPNARDAVNH